MKTTKSKFFIIFSILGALFLTGLFFFKKQVSTPELASRFEKPSQLDFSQSNQITEVKPVREQATVTQPNLSSSDQHELPKAQKLLGVDQEKWNVFKIILQSKNDNDRRLDSDLKQMSPAVHEALYETYETLPDEDRNGRGLITFLIARNISTAEDLQFLKKVYQETPCLSLADCKTLGPDDSHHSSVEQTTLTYPQMSALYMLEKQLSEQPQLLSQASFRSGVIQVLIQAESFPVVSVQNKARTIRMKFNL